MHNPMQERDITKHIASIVLNHFRSEGYRPSTGEGKVIAAIAGVDYDVQEAFACGFPALVKAVRIAQCDRDGIETLREIAGAA